MRDLRVEQVEVALDLVVAADERLCAFSLRGDLLLELGDVRLVAADARSRGARRHGQSRERGTSARST